MRRITSTAVSLTVVLLASLAAAPPSPAASPWWQLSSGARPTYIQPGSAKSEVQDLTVNGSPGQTFVLANLTTKQVEEGEFENAKGEPEYAEFKVGDEPSAIQAGLEAPAVYGAGNVEVSGGPGSLLGLEPYLVTFKGGLADQLVALINTELSPVEAKVTQRVEGRADGEIVVTAENLGDGAVVGEASAVTLVDTLPQGYEAVGIAGTLPSQTEFNSFGHGSSVPLSCSSQSEVHEGKLTCTLTKALEPYSQIEMRITVRADPGVSSNEGNRVSVAGGGAPTASITRPIVIGETTPFGVEDFRARLEEDGGASDIQAGSHPFQFTTTVAINQGPDSAPLSEPIPDAGPAVLAKDVYTKLPAGLLGNPTLLPTCSTTQFLALTSKGDEDECPPQTAIGVASVTVDEPFSFHQITFTQPVFNLQPGFGEPARFGFFVTESNTPVVLDTVLRDRPGEDYGITVNATNITQDAGLTSARVTVWGTPGDPRHDNSRGWGCLEQTDGVPAADRPSCTPSEEAKPAPFLVLPTSCAVAPQASVEVDSWAAPGELESFPPSEPLATLGGCNRLPFTPAIQVAPTTDRASAPSGLDFNLDFKNEGLLNEEGLAQSQLKDTAVVLPEGFTINPSAGVGLTGCRPGDYARETVDSAPGTGCPNSSKLGSVEIETPLLTQKIHGSIFIAEPYENPFGSLVALYIVAKNPETGVSIKLAGKVTPNPLTGQLVTTFENNPQLPFDHFNFHFREGQQAPLISPPVCGTYITQAALTPWSEPTATLTDTSQFAITRGFDGGACPSGGVPPFTPQITAGMASNNAGSFSPFDLRLTRTDGEAEISSFSTGLPPGLTGILAGIPYCPEADIALARSKTGVQEESQPSCAAASQLGHSLVGTGAGAVLAYTPGRIYLAGPYNGAPFSLVSVTSAVVGPFDLGTVVVRFGLQINPHTAQVSVDPTASEPIPTIIQGIVTHVRDIRVYIDRPNFTLNPTSCEPTSISSTVTSNLSQSTTVSSPFQAASCASLKFTPKITVTTAAQSSKANGASLIFKIAYPHGAVGSQSWFNEAKFDLPKQLPARLTTIQKACIASVFESNPAACPPASLIGHAVVRTQVLPVPLTGPVYFVSHGGAKFPDAVIVLQGDGVTVDLTGETFINGKTGITSATFRNTPDVPFESIEVTIPSGRFSEFGANLAASAKGSFCGQKLVMPTFFKAQNGLEFHQRTPVGVTGCSTKLSISSHKVIGHNLILTVHAPAAGRLKVSGKGLSSASKTTRGTETLTLTLHVKKRGRFDTKIKLTYTPTKGTRQAKTASLRV